MGEFLRDLAALELGGALVILLLLTVRYLSGHRYGAKWRCLAWLLLSLRLAVPLPLPVPAGGAEALEAPVQITVPRDPVVFSVRVDKELVGEPGQTTMWTTYQEPIALSDLLFVAWAAGAAVVLAGAALRHRRFLRYLRRWSAPVTDGATLAAFEGAAETLGLVRRPNLRTCEGLQVPMMAGLFRPVLLLPVEEMEGLDYAILHELTHQKRRDIPRKALMLWVCALHWFDPLVWYMARRAEEDMELACDEAVLKDLPREDHGAYGRTILLGAERLKGGQV